MKIHSLLRFLVTRDERMIITKALTILSISTTKKGNWF